MNHVSDIRQSDKGDQLLPAHSIPDLVFQAAQKYPNITAIEDQDEKISYQQLPQRALAVSKALIQQGIQPGDRVAIWAPNSARWVLAALGLQMAGAVMVPLNTRMKAKEAADILERSGARVLFMIGDFLDVDYPAMLAPECPATVERKVLITPRSGELMEGVVDWEAYLQQGNFVTDEFAQKRAQAVGPDDLSDLMFTSGTTGKPKGVMSAHGACLKVFNQYVQVTGIRPGDRYLVVNPFFHAFGYKAGWVTCLLAGATILPQSVFDAEEVFARIEQDKINILPGPPTLYLSLLAHPKLAQADLSSLRVAVTGAATIPPVLIEQMRNDLGFEVVTTAYGLTECGGLATICDPDIDAETIATTSGKAVAGTEVSIQDSDGNILAAGASGEICLRGFHVMQGYYQNESATAETIDSDGWLHTGDVGSLDDNGYLKITDRLKDMFIVGGFNCYPAEIEATLAEHPAIAQSAVIGVPDERMGEVGCAFVVLKSGTELQSDELIQWSRQRMANYKVPRFVRFVAELPVNASNKVVKAELVEQFHQA
ncbi:MAG: fatty acid--CoA ligase [Oceanospirillaceae bacterium]|nr:fatty acid--CoA ligase [Oceanospirillaceae bacterium]